MHNRHTIAGFLGYNYCPTYPGEANEQIDRLLAIEAKQGLNAMMDAVAEILQAQSPTTAATEFVLGNIAFIAELTELSRKYGRVIGSSGYGDPPRLYKIKVGSKGRYTATLNGGDIEWEEAGDG